MGGNDAFAPPKNTRLVISLFHKIWIIHLNITSPRHIHIYLCAKHTKRTLIKPDCMTEVSYQDSTRISHILYIIPPTHTYYL